MDSSLCFVFSALRDCRLLPRALGEQNGRKKSLAHPFLYNMQNKKKKELEKEQERSEDLLLVGCESGLAKTEKGLNLASSKNGEMLEEDFSCREILKIHLMRYL